MKQLQVIVIAAVLHTSAVRVETKIDSTTNTGESVADPKAEALTLIVHRYPPSSKVRPVKLIDRNDDVVVIHTNRPKRKPSSRNRRPSSSQYRSKIKPSSPGNSPVAGFKDFTSSDYRFPQFPTKTFGEPPRASNKYKRGPKPFESYGHSSPINKKSRKPPTFYGPPPTFNRYESTFIQDNQQSPPYDGGKQRLQTLQSLQQQQSNFPSYSIDTVEPSSSNNYGSNSAFDKFPQPISNFPLEAGSSFNSQKNSYGSPVRGQGSISSSNFNSNPTILATNLNPNAALANHNFNPNKNFNDNQNFKPNPTVNDYQNFNSNSNQNFNDNQNFKPNPTVNSYQNFNSNTNSNSNSNSNPDFPRLPSRYETKDFSTPTKSNPLGNQFLNDYSNNNFNDASETQNVQTLLNQHHQQNRNRLKNFNKFNNYDYDFGKNQKNNAPPVEDDDDEDDDYSGSIDYSYTTRRPFTFTTTTTTTTTPPPPSSTKRPRKNGYGKRKRPAKIAPVHNLDTQDLRDAFTESSDLHEIALSSDDFINFDSQRHRKRNQSPEFLHEIHSTLKTARDQNSALRTALGDDYQILSVEKSQEKDPNDFDFRFQRKSDNFVVGSDLRFGGEKASSVVWNGDFKNFPRNHRFS